MKKFLATPYYLSNDPARQRELDACLRSNIANEGIDKIFLFVDDGHAPPVRDPKVNVIEISERLTYRDWLAFVRDIGEEHIAVLSNTDIYFDESITQLDQILHFENRLVALSRHELLEGSLAPHPKPQMSQDAWALNSRSELTQGLLRDLDFPLGVPRCDNKVIYEFAMHGWDIINPFPNVRAVHVHETNLRNYNKLQDRAIVGGVGFAFPQGDFNRDSDLDISVWPRSTAHVSSVRLVSALEIWDRNEDAIIALDRDWQYPAITEKHAFDRMMTLRGVIPENCAYFGFPWATLIDRKQSNPETAGELEDELRQLRYRASRKRRVATVCQHIKMLNHQKLFNDSGVTDVFWSHAVKGQHFLPDYPNIRIHPFPLYPVQIASTDRETTDRPILFSFVGARAKHFYLTRSRDYILDLLSDHPDGLVLGRDDWHYNKIVYDHQINKTAATARGLVDEDASSQFRDALANSTFSLCPSGSGPNSIRLWESLAAGSIPVVLADTHALPGNSALWREAAVFCDETPKAIKELPDRLKALAADAGAVSSKRRATAQLLTLYGRDTFVYDIIAFFVGCAGELCRKAVNTLPAGDEELEEIARAAEAPGANFKQEVLLAMCASRLILDPPGFRQVLNDTPRIRKACENAAAAGETPAAKNFIHARALAETYRRQKPRQIRKPRMKVALLGRNVLRTPLAYSVYQEYFTDEIEIVDGEASADILVFGASPNIREEGDRLLLVLADDPTKPIAVISEEPLWDTTWSFEHDKKISAIEYRNQRIGYANLSFTTSNIFNFDSIPYFLTTNDDFFVRYFQMLSRNSKLTPSAILHHWSNAKYRAAFIAERRRHERYEFEYKAEDLIGLCGYRTRLAEGFTGPDILRQGAGWEENVRRQALADWHLDKLTMLDRKAFLVSGLENTHQPHYITEKIFDAFAVLGVPIYYASPDNRIHEMLPEGSFLNVYGMTSDEAASYLETFKPDVEFIERYRSAQEKLLALFGSPDLLAEERKNTAMKVVKALQGLLETPPVEGT